MTQSNAAANPFKKLTTFKERGAVLNCMVAGSTPESEKFYLSYVYRDFSLQLVAVDPSHGYVATAYDSASENQWEGHPCTSEAGAWGMVVDPDGNIYLGTIFNAHLFKFSTQTNVFTDLGQPQFTDLQPQQPPQQPPSIYTEQYIWSLTVSPYDKKIYGGTYPHAHLFSYDPNAPNTSKQFEDLGPMDPDPDSRQPNQYARYCVADPDRNNPYIYIGLGSTHSKIVAYKITSKEKKRILPDPYKAISDLPSIWLGSDQQVYGCVGSGEGTYKLNNFINGTLTSPTLAPAPTPNHLTPPDPPTGRFQNGDTITIDEDRVKITHSNGTVPPHSCTYTYPGKDLTIFRVGTGPDGNIYAGTAMPFYLASLSPANSEEGFARINAQLGGGEAYSLLVIWVRLRLILGNHVRNQRAT